MEKDIGYFLSRKKRRSISIPDKVRMNSCYFVVTITTEKTKRNLTVIYLSVYLENSERIYFTENRFQKRHSLLFFFELRFLYEQCMACHALKIFIYLHTHQKINQKVLCI